MRRPEKPRPRRRLLFVGEAASLAHVARPLRLAQAVDRSRWEVWFACDERYRNFVAQAELPWRGLPSLAPEAFRARLAAGAPLFDRQTLEDEVAADGALLDDLRPDLVVGDFRVSLGISAPKAGVPYANLCNAHWSPHSTLVFPAPELPVLRHLGAQAGPLVRLAAPAVFRLHARAFNALRQRHGLPPVRGIREMYTLGTWTLFADLPELAPLSRLPESQRYLGPVIWSPDEALPPGLFDREDRRPLVYVTLGASGTHRVMKPLLAALAALPLRAVLATAGRPIRVVLPSNVTAVPYLPAREVLARARVCVFNGGCATGYQALGAGVPVLGLPENADQFLFMTAVARRGAGLCVRPTFASAPRIGAALEVLLEREEMGLAARDLQRQIAGWDSGENFRRFLAERPEVEGARNRVGADLARDLLPRSCR